MKIRNSFLMALEGLKTNKGRSALTILGIVIGISAVITTLSVGEGAESLIIKEMSSLGSNNIFVEPGAWSERMERGTMMQSMMEEMEIKTLKYEDGIAISKLPTVEAVGSFNFGVDRVVYENNTKKLTFVGATPEMAEIVNIRCILGRNITEDDLRSMSRVVVLGFKVRQDLFGQENPVGKTVRLKKISFRVIGVMEERGPQAFLDLDQSVYIPLTTTQKLLLGQNYVRNILVKVRDEEQIERTIYDIRQLLRERHNIHNPEGDPAKDDFKVMSQKEATNIVGNITSIFTVLLSSIAAISLLVGGIGIMNIMLVSVTERTREVGLRKAVGAKKKDILRQFLLESIFLTLVGGFLGIILGAIFSFAASLAFGYFLGSSWGFLLSLRAIVLGLTVSFLVGLVFGIYPAYKASQLDPITALRYE